MVELSAAFSLGGDRAAKRQTDPKSAASGLHVDAGTHQLSPRCGCAQGLRTVGSHSCGKRVGSLRDRATFYRLCCH